MLDEGTVVDATYLSAKALSAFLADEIEKTKQDGIMFSLHLKATMMKVSDPIIFGHAVTAWMAPIFEKYGDALAEAGVSANSGMGDVLKRIEGMPNAAEIKADIEALKADRPSIYMVDSDKGHHQPSCAVRCHYRCVHACAHPRWRQGLG